MKRCLSDNALMRLQAGDGSAEQRAHLSACGACGDRYRRFDRELETVRHALLHTDEPRMLVVTRRPSWVPIAAVAASLVTLAVWGHLAVRRPDVPASATRPLPDEEASVFLRDVSLTMFSINGRLAVSGPEGQIAGLPGETADRRAADCEWLDWSATGGCGEAPDMGRLLDLFEPTENDL